MRKCKVIISILLVLSIFLSISAAAVDLSETNLKNDSSMDFEGLFPSFTQEDFNSNFLNYASNESTFSVDSDTKTIVDKAKETSSTQNISNAIGTVFQQNTNKPIPNAYVSVLDSDTDTVMAVVKTDSNGRFQIWGLPDDIYNWKIDCIDYKTAEYNGYDVCAGEITSIFTFYISDSEAIIKNNGEFNNDPSAESISVTSAEKSVEIQATTQSFTSAPKLSSFKVGVNGVATTVPRYTYLCYVVANEALGYYQCKNFGMTDSQIKNYYAAQAVAANTFLEYEAKVNKKHGSKYTVCDTSHCQKYDPTKTSEFAILGVSMVSGQYAGDWYAYLQVHKSNGKYNYIYGAYFARCNGKTKTYGTSQPALKSVSCTNIDKSTTQSGNGWGLCQYGAAYKAKKGSSWTSILSYYYSSTTSLMCFY